MKENNQVLTNAAGVPYPTVDEQRRHWINEAKNEIENEKHRELLDIGGNVIPDRVAANNETYSGDPFTDEKLWEMGCVYDRDGIGEDGDPYGK